MKLRSRPFLSVSRIAGSFIFVLWPFRCLHLHDVGVDHLVSLQRVLRDGLAFPGALRQAVSWWRLGLHTAHRGDWELHGQRGMQWVYLFFSFFSLFPTLWSHDGALLFDSTSSSPLALSSQQLPGYRVGRMGCLQCHLRSWHEEEGAHGEDAPCGRLHLWGRGAGSGEVHDARMPWVAASLTPPALQIWR